MRLALARIFKDTFTRGGNLVIPAFYRRTYAGDALFSAAHQEDREAFAGISEAFEVYVDSPLAVEATSIFGKNVSDCFDEEALVVGESGRSIRSAFSRGFGWRSQAMSQR